VFETIDSRGLLFIGFIELLTNTFLETTQATFSILLLGALMGVEREK
jgi:hypothetical protein